MFASWLKRKTSIIIIFFHSYILIPNSGKIINLVKYDEFLPSYLQAVLSGMTAQRSAVSKYTWCRRYENKEF